MATDPALIRLGEAVRQRRDDELGLTQEDAAAKADVSTATWGKVERATELVGRKSLRRICVALGWPPDSYEQILDGNPPTQVIRTEVPVQTVNSLDGKFSRLTKAQQDAVLAVINGYLDEE